MKNKVMILAAAITLVACGGNQQKKAVSEKVKADAVKVDMHDAESPGIDMRLTLKKDGTYSLHMKYLDRDSEFDEKGAYKVKGNLLTLTPMDGQPEYYKVEENQVRKLNADKQPVTGALAENYVLKKTE